MPVLQGLRERLPDRRRHGDVQGRGAAPAVRRPRGHGRTTLWAGCRGGRVAGPVVLVANRVAGGPLARMAKAVPAWTVAGRSRSPLRCHCARASDGRVPGTPARDRHTTPPRRVDLGGQFTDHFLPQDAEAAIRVLAAAGLRARSSPSARCALTWITTGQLDRAPAIVERTVAMLAPYVASGAPIIGWSRPAWPPSAVTRSS